MWLHALQYDVFQNASSIFDRLGNKTNADALDSTPPTVASEKRRTGVTITKRPLVKTTTTGKSLRERLGILL
jgi:hypothetical protein